MITSKLSAYTGYLRTQSIKTLEEVAHGLVQQVQAKTDTDRKIAFETTVAIFDYEALFILLTLPFVLEVYHYYKIVRDVEVIHKQMVEQEYDRMTVYFDKFDACNEDDVLSSPIVSVLTPYGCGNTVVKLVVSNICEQVLFLDKSTVFNAVTYLGLSSKRGNNLWKSVAPPREMEHKTLEQYEMSKTYLVREVLDYVRASLHSCKDWKGQRGCF